MKRIIISLGIIAVVALAVVGATVSYFSDVEESKGNLMTASAGYLDLKTRDNDEGWGNGVTATWTADNILPGDELKFKVEQVDLAKEAGSIDADHIEIAANYRVIEESPCAKSDTDCETYLHPDKMAKEMLITRCVYHDIVCVDCLTGKKYDGFNYGGGVCSGNLLGQSVDWGIEDQDSDGKISFFDLKNDPLDNLPPVPNSPPFSFQMSAKFDEDAGNDFQGDSFIFDAIFTLNEDASQ